MDHVFFPRFWVEEPALWFAQVEAVFALNNITTDTDKYHYILCELPSSVISLVKDLILDSAKSNEDKKYNKIKEDFIKRISISELKKEDIGSRKSSQFLKKIKEEADPLVSKATVKEVWINGLPLHVKHIVSEMKGDIDTLCHLADTVKEIIPSSNDNWVLEKKQENVVNQAESVSRIFEQLKAQLKNIESELKLIKFACTEKNKAFALCEKCQGQAFEDKSANNSVHNSIINGSKASDSKSNDSVNHPILVLIIFLLLKKKILKRRLAGITECMLKMPTIDSLPPCNFKEKKALEENVNKP